MGGLTIGQVDQVDPRLNVKADSMYDTTKLSMWHGFTKGVSVVVFYL